MLRSFNKMPYLYRAVVLIVGAPGVGKHQLAKALVVSGSQLPIQVRTATRLPLPEDTHGSRPRIDFVIFMVDQTRRESFLAVKRSLPFLDSSYRNGKMCFVLTQVNSAIYRSVSFDAMIQLAENCNSQMLCCDLQNDVERNHVSQQLISKMNSSIGLQNGVSSLLIDCTRVVIVPAVTADL